MSRTRCARSAWVSRMPASSSGYSTFSCAVSTGSRLKFWNTKPSRRARKSDSASSERRPTSSPATTMRPRSGRSTQPTRFSSVDFPLPDAPAITVNLPSRISSVTSRSAVTLTEPIRYDFSTASSFTAFMVSIYEVGGPRQQERSRCAEYQLGARGKPVRWGSAALASAHARRARSGRTRARRATRHASPGLRVRTGQRGARAPACPGSGFRPACWSIHLPGSSCAARKPRRPIGCCAFLAPAADRSRIGAGRSRCRAGSKSPPSSRRGAASARLSERARPRA